MSAENGEAGTTCSRCASCGVAESDNIKLRKCTACYLVKYCGIQCQKEHRPKHKKECKQRVAKLRDELLFKQPESSHLGDCPICSLPLPLVPEKSTLMTCCSKVICDGCDYANHKRENEMRLQHSCPFCRKATPATIEENYKRNMKRVKMNDPVAISQEGVKHYDEGDYRSAIECFTKAAELGNADAHCRLSCMYQLGCGVEKDGGKFVHHLEEAAIGGHPDARYGLGYHEWHINRNIERAVKHWIIAATQGDDSAVKELLSAFRNGDLSKDDLASTLRAHKAAVDATESPQRVLAEKIKQINEEAEK